MEKSINMKKSLSASGWLPNYHGAWAMITVPIILGIVLSGFQWIHLCLMMLWWLGYFCFFATSMWLRSGRHAALFPPVRVYGMAMLIPAVVLICLAPYLGWWLVLDLPLLALTVRETMRHRERSFLNDTVTVLIACSTLPVAYDLGTTGIVFEVFGCGGLWGSGYLSNPRCDIFHFADWQTIWLMTLLVAGYFIGTVFYVKTNMRERKSDNYLIASVIFHVVLSLVAFIAADRHIIAWEHFYVWILLTLRSLLVPLYGRYRHRVSVKKIGFGELIFSVLIFMTLV